MIDDQRVGVVWPDGTVTGNIMEATPTGWTIAPPPGGYVDWSVVWAEDAARTPVVQPPVRDWHATFLTDPRCMGAARQRAAQHGEDGWAAAYTLALTLPPAPGSYDAIGARDVLVPDTLPDAAELERLERNGYYNEPGIARLSPDLGVSMLRRARPNEKTRPDLACPKCRTPDDDTGMINQAYRCPQCGESWVTERDPDDCDDPYEPDCGCDYCRARNRELADAGEGIAVSLDIEAVCDADRRTIAARLLQLWETSRAVRTSGGTVTVSSNPLETAMGWYRDAITAQRSGELLGILNEPTVDETWSAAMTAGRQVVAAQAASPPPEVVDQRALLFTLEAVDGGTVTWSALAMSPILRWVHARQLVVRRPWTAWPDDGQYRHQLTPTGRAELRRLRQEFRPPS